MAVVIEGLDDAIRALRELPKKLRFVAIRKALKAAGQVFQAQAIANAPVLAQSTKYRTAGLVKKNIVVRASKIARRRGDLGSYVTVRKLSAAKILKGKAAGFGAGRNPFDPFYFRFLEKGTKKMAARPFLSTAFAAKGNAAIEAFSGEIRRAIVIENSRR